MSNRPNFLFLITDQHRADWLGCSGHPVVKTPNIDAIAAAGTMFENFHVTSPVCMPNRASLITGRYPSVHGLRTNGCLLPLRANTFVDVLAQSGYHTAAIGKSHLQPFTDLAPLNRSSGETGPIAEAWKADDFDRDYGQEQPGHYRADGRYDFKTPYYGYQHVDMVTEHGDLCGGHYRQWFRDKAPDWQALSDRANQLPHTYSCPQAFRTPIPEELYPTAYIRDRTVDYLRDRKDRDDPFFAFVSFPDPHHPFNPPGRYWDMYSPDDFEVRLPYEAHRNPTPPMRFLHQNWQNGIAHPTPQTAMMTDERSLREAMALTAGMINMVDDMIGDIVRSRKETGQYDNTVICFNTDHGDYLGDFNMLLKGALPFRSVTHVPFLWSDPQSRVPKRTAALASTIDISSSVLERAGIKPYHGIQGKSVLDCLDGSADLRTSLLTEYNDGGPRLGFETPARVRSLLTDRYRFTFYKGLDWGELYDLEADPDETHNLWDAAEHAQAKAELSLLMNHHLADLMDESPRATRPA